MPSVAGLFSALSWLTESPDSSADMITALLSIFNSEYNHLEASVEHCSPLVQHKPATEDVHHIAISQHPLSHGAEA